MCGPWRSRRIRRNPAPKGRFLPAHSRELCERSCGRPWLSASQRKARQVTPSGAIRRPFGGRIAPSAGGARDAIDDWPDGIDPRRSPRPVAFYGRVSGAEIILDGWYWAHSGSSSRLGSGRACVAGGENCPSLFRWRRTAHHRRRRQSSDVAASRRPIARALLRAARDGRG